MADAPPPYSAVQADQKSGPYPPAGYPPTAGFAPPPPQPGYSPQQPGYPQGYQSQPGPYPPPGAPGYPPAGQAVGTTHNTVVVTQPALTVVQTFHEAPVRTVCPHCRADIVTATHYESGTFSWLICVILCLVGCQLGCCLIPFCVDSCQDVIHTCPNCRQQISRWGRM